MFFFPEAVQWRKLCFGSQFKGTVRQGWEGVVAGMAVTMATASHTSLIGSEVGGRLQLSWISSFSLSLEPQSPWDLRP